MQSINNQHGIGRLGGTTDAHSHSHQTEEKHTVNVTCCTECVYECVFVF